MKLNIVIGILIVIVAAGITGCSNANPTGPSEGGDIAASEVAHSPGMFTGALLGTLINNILI